MSNKRTQGTINRREFLGAGIAGTASLVLGGSALLNATPTDASDFSFPKPVYRTHGRTGLNITVVSFGAMLTPESEVMRVAFDNGVNYVDTARRYMGGKNEEIVGKAVKGIRNKLYIATKTQPASISASDITKDIETSLKSLQTDYIDVIQLHNLTSRERVYHAETREALMRAKQEGKVRYFGVTSHTNVADVVNSVVDDKDRFFDTVLVAYNFKSGRDVHDAIQRAAAAGIGVIAMKTQQGGYETSAMGQVSHHQAALKWALQNRNITAAIPGMKDMAQLREDIAVMGMPFTAADERVIRKYNAALDGYYCAFCGKCEGSCPLGIQISSINRAMMYAEAYGSAELAVSTYREVSTAARASACNGCAECSAFCVNGVDIAARMERARIFFS